MKTPQTLRCLSGLCLVFWAVARIPGAPCVLAGEASAKTAQEAKGVYVIEESFQVEASRKVVWEVLTDYDHMQRFVSSMHSSRALRHDGRLIVEQESSGSFFFIRKKVRLELRVDETPMDLIAFQDVGGKDFSVYVGSWRLEPAANGVRVSYSLRATPNFPTPRWFASGIFRGTVRRLLEEVRSEIISREKGEISGNSIGKRPL